MNVLKSQVTSLIAASMFSLSDIKPSDWHEKYRVLKTDESPFPGSYSYSRSPMLREVVDCFHPGHPAKIISMMKGGQIGVTTGVVEAAIGWIISQNPGNILYLTGNSELSEKAIVRVDKMIDSTGIRHLIKSSVMRKKNARTGDTNKSKEFPGGMLVSGSANNHSILRQIAIQFAFIDDFDAAKKADKSSGDTRKMIEQRGAAFYDKMKFMYLSSPETKAASNIEPVYKLGDQRKWHIPCPCCNEFITLEWSIEVEGDEKKMGGISWQLDSYNKVIPESVGYVCQRCGSFFDDKNKDELLNKGKWIATAEPLNDTYVSYHLSCLYTPAGMFDWAYYVNSYLEANPTGQPQIESLQRTFDNVVLGLTFEPSGDAPTANEVQSKIRDYQIGIIPEKVSIADGNGKIMLLTCACDMNGTIEDGRLDWEIIAHSESGSTYSIDHGSIGTFIPREGSKKHKTDREKWTYEHHKSNSVWGVFDDVLKQKFETDNGRSMQVFITALDCGHFTTQAYSYLDVTNNEVIGFKGDKESKYTKFGIDVAPFKQAKERAGVYMIEVGKVKDRLASLIKLNWDSQNDDVQPPGFLNFPQPAARKYQYETYFKHYEAEKKVILTKDGINVSYIWKKQGNRQNHFWDVMVYNQVIRDVYVSKVAKEIGAKNFTWFDYVSLINQSLNNKK